MSDLPHTPDDLASLVADRERTAGLPPPMAPLTIQPLGYPSSTANAAMQKIGSGGPSDEALKQYLPTAKVGTFVQRPDGHWDMTERGWGRLTTLSLQGINHAVFCRYCGWDVAHCCCGKRLIGATSSRQQERDAAVDQQPAHIEDAAERRHRELIARLDKLAEAMTVAVQILRSTDPRVG